MTGPKSCDICHAVWEVGQPSTCTCTHDDCMFQPAIATTPSAPTAEMLNALSVFRGDHPYAFRCTRCDKMLSQHQDGLYCLSRDSLAALARSEPPTTEARLTELRTETTAFVAKMKDGTLSAKDFSPEDLALAREVLGRSEPPSIEAQEHRLRLTCCGDPRTCWRVRCQLGQKCVEQKPRTAVCDEWDASRRDAR